MTFLKPKPLRIGLPTRRIEALSDGVFAIAMTLLVLEIAVPVISKEELSYKTLLIAITALWPKILSYAISIGVISIFWVGHHIMFNYVQRTDRILLWLNSMYLMVIAFIPFPAALMGEYGSERVAVIVYGATLALAGIVFEFMWLHVSSNYHLIDKRMDPKLIKKASHIVLIAPIVYVIAILCTFIHPLISIIIYIVVPFLYILPGPIDDFIDILPPEDSEHPV